jgi:hypothetical protein
MSHHDPVKALMRRRASHDWKHDEPAALRTVVGGTALREVDDRACRGCGYSVCSCLPPHARRESWNDAQPGVRRFPCSLPGGLVPPGWEQTEPCLKNQVERYIRTTSGRIVAVLKNDTVRTYGLPTDGARDVDSVEAGMLLAMGWRELRAGHWTFENPHGFAGMAHYVSTADGHVTRVNIFGDPEGRHPNDFPSLVHAAHWAMTGELPAGVP